jgi:uncharacterized protein YcbK (DUF882 family)
MKVITLLDYYQGRGHEVPLDVEENARVLLGSVNRLLKALNIDTTVNSGYRPALYNKAIGGAKNSYHVQGKAIDLKDTGGMIAYKIIQNYTLLEDLGLWLEWPGATRGWVHLDDGERPDRTIRTFLP